MTERLEFAGPVAGTSEVAGAGWRLEDESAMPKMLVYEDFNGGEPLRTLLGVSFGTSATAAGGSLACGVRPGEWLLLGERSGADSPAGGAVTVDLTHGMAMFRLSGPAAQDVLAAVCSVDTAEAMLPDGAVCGASVARVACTLVRNDVAAERSYLILSQRSSGRYLFDALRDAGVHWPSRRRPSTPAQRGTMPPN